MHYELGGKWGKVLRSTTKTSAHRQYIKALKDNEDFIKLWNFQQKDILNAANETIQQVNIRNGYIPTPTYLQVIEHAPIVSIDLIIFNNEGNVLLGKRKNEPAKEFWFVPGGRLRKNESNRTALERIADEELGTSFQGDEFSLSGAYNHIYNNNFKHNKFGTHYICFAYSLILDKPLNPIKDDQHTEFIWLNPIDVMKNPQVHSNVKNYFHPTPWNKIT